MAERADDFGPQMGGVQRVTLLDITHTPFPFQKSLLGQCRVNWNLQTEKSLGKGRP